MREGVAMLCKRVQTLDSNVQKSQNRTVHLKSRATLWKETEVASAPQSHGRVFAAAAGCQKRRRRVRGLFLFPMGKPKGFSITIKILLTTN
jgi:hypothetical protein